MRLRASGNLLSVFVVAWVLFGMASTAGAALFEVTDPNAPGGAGNITRDDATGLDWLDLTASAGLSFNDVAGQFGSGQPFEGFRHATRAELETFFFTSAGITPGTQNPAEQALIDLQNLVGTTAAGSLIVLSSGFYDDTLDGLGLLPGTAVLFVDLNFGTPVSSNTVFTPDNNGPAAGTTNWLVRATPVTVAPQVPEPGSALLFGSGLAALVYLRRRRQTRPSEVRLTTDGA